MGAEYGPALDMWNDSPDYVFVGALGDPNVPNSDISIVCHKTASGPGATAQSIGAYFNNNEPRVTAHFVVGKDGTVVQVVRLANGAGANCCINGAYDPYWNPFWNKYKNLNLCTISIEHIDETLDNSDPMPQAQIDASNALIKWLCDLYSITADRIKSHASIDPINRERCPGSTFNFDQLFQHINSGGSSTPTPPPVINLEGNPHVEQQLQDTYKMTDAYLQLVFKASARTDSGIYNSWRQAYLHGHNFGPPTTLEKNSVDWNGNPIIVVLFMYGRCEWANGQAHFYDANDALIYQA